MGIVDTDVDNTVAADPAPDHQPTSGVGNAAGELQSASEEAAAPDKKRTKLDLNHVSYSRFANLTSHV